jgi:hypothetical protein
MGLVYCQGSLAHRAVRWRGLAGLWAPERIEDRRENAPSMVAARLKNCDSRVEIVLGIEKQRSHHQHVFSEDQNDLNADVLTEAGEFCKRLW